LNLVSSSKSRKIFLSSNTKIYENSKVDIILSPEFYWVRIFDIPEPLANSNPSK
jgi:predicted transcriptional regulator